MRSTYVKMDGKCFISYKKVNIGPFRSKPHEVLMVILQLIEEISSA